MASKRTLLARTGLLACCLVAVSSATDVTTYKNDFSRTGQNLSETSLTLANVSPSTFGLLRTLPVDGKVDAQPLYLSQLSIAGGTHNVVIAATEHDSVYAFDSDTGAVLWQRSMLLSGETTSDSLGCYQIVPEIGVTSTPVIDRTAGAHGVIYLVAMSKDSSSNYHHRLHALDLTTGADLRIPVTIAASFPLTAGGSTVFDPKQHVDRAALLLINKTIYVTFGSHCDVQPYMGWIMGYSQTNLAHTVTTNVGANGHGVGPGIWMAGSGPSVDSSGNIYMLTGNGPFEKVLDANGFPSKKDFGNSFIKLANTGSQLVVTDYFAMSNEVAESQADEDLGASGQIMLPDLTDQNGTVRQLLIGGGKDGSLYLVDRTNMGKYSPTSDSIWQFVSKTMPGGIRSTPAYFNGSVYYSENTSTLKAYAIVAAKVVAPAASQTATSFVYPGTSPAVSANATENGIVWAQEHTNPGVLHAYDATNLATELYNTNQAAGNRDHFGPGNKFVVPTIVDGKVFLGTTNSIAVFGLL